MKQFVIGIGLVVTFVAYSLWVRHEQPVLAKPPSVVVTTSTSQPATAGKSSQAAGSSAGANAASKPLTAAYRSGSYTGSVEDAFYGNVQVMATITNGSLSDVAFLQYPHTHSDSVMINQQAMPWLKQEAIQKQTANVDIISGATFTSQAFVQSLTTALNQARSA